MGAIGIGVGTSFKRGGVSWSSYWLTRTPTDLVLTVVSDTRIDGTFTINGTGQDGHKVYTSTDNVTFTLNQTLTGSDNTFSVIGLTQGTLYYFYIKAYKGSNESSESNTYLQHAGLWYLAGGIAASAVVNANKFIDTANETASLVNLANPGTNDLVKVGTPTWAQKFGWSAFATTKYLYGASYHTHTYSFAILFNDTVTDALAGRAFSGEGDGSGTKGSYAIPSGYLMQASDYIVITLAIKGVIGANQAHFFINGVSVDDVTPAGAEYTKPMIIGAGTGSGGLPPIQQASPFKGKVLALVVYNTSITDAQMSAVQQRMLQDSITITSTRFSGLTRYGSNPTVTHNSGAYNAFGVSTPFFKIENKIGNTYYGIAQGSPTNWSTWDNFILYTSTDLINWTDQGVILTKGAVGAWDNAYIVHPCTVKIGSTWYMYYSAINGLSVIGLATSTDFVNWTKYGATAIYSGNGTSHAYSPCVILIGSTYYMYYWNGHSNSTAALEYATSVDGITWAYGGVALAKPLSTDWDYFAGNGITIDPWVIKNSNGYYEMVYTATNVGIDQDLGYAISSDGKTWYKHNGAILNATGAGWESTWLGDPCLVELTDGTTHLYYGGAGGAYPGTTYDAGMATI
jgi:predicted GH43/DUF377 family glycosyl hydrolase